MSKYVTDSWNFLSSTVSHYSYRVYVKCVGWAISGHVRRNKQAVAGATVTLSGGKDDTATTDAGGAYSFPKLWDGASFTVTAAHDEYEMSAPVAVGPLTKDETANFQARKLFTLSGTVKGAEKVKVTCGTMTTVTKSGGKYSFVVPEKEDVTVTPTVDADHESTPSSTRILMQGADRAKVDFTISLKTHSISGVVTTPVKVTVTVTDGAELTRSYAQVESLYGAYNLPLKKKYTVTVDPGLDYDVDPKSRIAESLTADVNDFHFTVTRKTWKVSVAVKPMTDPLLKDIALKLTGSKTADEKASEQGAFEFTLDSGGDYTITPDHKHFTFEPANKKFTTLRAKQSVDFKPTRREWPIVGTVASANATSKKVTVRLEGGGQDETDETDDEGRYRFDVPAGEEYTITPEPTDQLESADPESVTIDELTQKETRDFTGTWREHGISGKVTESAVALPKIPIRLTSDECGFKEEKSTEDDGTYAFDAAEKWKYEVTPYLPPYTFKPKSIKTPKLAKKLTDLDFAATWKQPRYTSARDPLTTTYGLDVAACATCGKKPILHGLAPIRETQASLDACRTLYAVIDEKWKADRNCESEDGTMLGVLICKDGTTYAAKSGSDKIPAGWTAAAGNRFTVARQPADEKAMVDRKKRVIPFFDPPPHGNPMSCCAAQKLLQRAAKDGKQPKEMTEMWYGKGGNDKKTMTSCTTCQIVAAQMLCDLDP